MIKSDVVDALDPLLELGEFSGSAREGLIALHRFYNAQYPGTGTVLLQSEAHAAERCQVTGYISAAGQEWVPGRLLVPSAPQSAWYQDALVARCIQALEPGGFLLGPAEQDTPLARALQQPEWLAAFPPLTTSYGRFHIVLARPRAEPAPAMDWPVLWKQTRLAFALLRGGMMGSLAAQQQQRISGLADIQRLLQPAETRIRGLQYAVHWQPAETAAGDYYDLMPLTHTHTDFTDQGSDAWGMMVADVSGHGAAAAMEAVQFDAILRTYRGDEQPGGPAGAATYANRYFFSRRQRPHYLTAFGASARPDRKQLQFVCAGHPPALHRRGRTLTWLGTGAQAEIPLGILRTHQWGNTCHDWQPGDLLLAYTDGVVEARDRQGNMLGGEKLAQWFLHAPPDAAGALAYLREALFEQQGHTIGRDDQTLVVLQQGG